MQIIGKTQSSFEIDFDKTLKLLIIKLKLSGEYQ